MPHLVGMGYNGYERLSYFDDPTSRHKVRCKFLSSTSAKVTTIDTEDARHDVALGILPLCELDNGQN